MQRPMLLLAPWSGRAPTTATRRIVNIWKHPLSLVVTECYYCVGASE